MLPERPERRVSPGLRNASVPGLPTHRVCGGVLCLARCRLTYSQTSIAFSITGFSRWSEGEPVLQATTPTGQKAAAIPINVFPGLAAGLLPAYFSKVPMTFTSESMISPSHPVRAACKLFSFLFLALALCSSMGAHAADATCASAKDNVTQGQCLSQNLSQAETELRELVQKIEQTLPKSDMMDDRKGRPQFSKAQESWQRYRDENCRFLGGLQGGNNRAVSIFSAECMLQETKARIKVLRHLPSHG
jgi:uncharacterized protein YecT (DUF1311 family)